MTQAVERFPRHRSNAGNRVRRRMAYLLASAVLLAGVAGCPPTRTPPAPLAAPIVHNAPAVGSLPMADGIVTPLPENIDFSGAALARSKMKLEPALAEAHTAARHPAASQPAGDVKADQEPPATAIKYYLQGRERLFQGATSEAIESFEQALRIDPNAFTVLRLMGRACFASNQLARGSLYLLQASTLHPNDPEVHYLLGRYWLEQKEYPTAIDYLAIAYHSPENSSSSPLVPLTHFYLAKGLQAAGYYRAAGEQFAGVLGEISVPRPSYRYDRELVLLTQSIGQLHLAAAENYFAAGDYASAAEHYALTRESMPQDAYILGRLITAEAYAGRLAEARRDAIGLALNAQASSASVDLLLWTYQQGAAGTRLEQDLARLLSEHPSAAPLAVALAEVRDRSGQHAAATETLTSFLDQNPGDLTVLKRLVSTARQNGTVPTAFNYLASALRAKPSLDKPIVELLSSLIQESSADTLLPTLASQATGPQGDYLRGLVAEAVDDRTGSAAFFASSIAANPEFWPARQAYVTLLLAGERYGEAQAAAEKAVAARQGGMEARLLLVQTQAAQHRYSAALKLAQEAKIDYPDALEIRLEIAAIYRLRGQSGEEINELSAAANAFADRPEVYERLISAYLNTRNRDSAIETLSRMIHQFPDNAFALTLTADYYGALGRESEGEEILRRLIKRNPDDAAPILALARLKATGSNPGLTTGGIDDAIAVLKEELNAEKAKNSVKPEVVDALATYLERGNKADEALALYENQAKAHPESDASQLAYGVALGRADRYGDAETVLRNLLTKVPRSYAVASALAEVVAAAGRPGDAAVMLQMFIGKNGESADRLYLVSHYLHDAGKFDETVSVLQRALALMPDHTGANNDLAYFLADKGVRLIDAEGMATKALDNRPNNAAFIDTLGWVYYKQGRFEDAVKTLTRAVELPEGIEPELLGHLGDALYRAGRKDEAQMRWQQGLSVGEGNPQMDAAVKQHLETVLKQTRDGSTVDVAPVGERK